VAEFFDVVSRQRACRDFTTDDVPDEDVERMLTAATHAPSAQNTQPWVFVVVRDAAVRTQLGDITRRLWAGGARASVEDQLAPALLADVDAGVERGFGGAPVVVVVAADETSGVHRRALGSSIFPAAQNLLLAANALGYGSALTTLTAGATDELRQLLALPDSITPMAIVPIGRPARPLGRPRRRPPQETTHRDRYGQPW
jgi:nitroreductase